MRFRVPKAILIRQSKIERAIWKESMRRDFVVFPLILIWSICAVGQTARGEANPQVVPDEEGIRKVLANFIEAWNKHDAKAFSMLFAEDADFTNVAGVSAHGRAEGREVSRAAIRDDIQGHAPENNGDQDQVHQA